MVKGTEVWETEQIWPAVFYKIVIIYLLEWRGLPKLRYGA